MATEEYSDPAQFSFKPCNKCFRVKPFTEYHVNNDNWDGRQSRCKPCLAEDRLIYCPPHPRLKWNGEPFQRCSKCHVTKPLEAFSRDKKALSGRVCDCKECHNAQSKARRLADPHSHNARNAAWQKANPDKCREKGRRWRRANPDKVRAAEKKHNTPKTRRQRKYGITPDQFTAMRESQGNACLICAKSFVQIVRPTAIDHDHDTGKVRGILCFKCNSALGLLCDDPKIVQAAADYLAHHKKTLKLESA